MSSSASAASSASVVSNDSDAGENSSASTSSCSRSAEYESLAQKHQCQHRDDTETEYASKVREWASKVPIGLGLCPWAGKSRNKGLLRIVTCECDASSDAAEMIGREIEMLTLHDNGAPPLSTTLMVCPHVNPWKEHFETFAEFVRMGIKQQLNDDAMLENVTLVAFHPQFLKWHGLPDGIGVGSVVQSHWGMIGRKSMQSAPATIVETVNQAFGLRKVRIRFRDPLPEGLSRPEQYVQIDWLCLPNLGLPLPDNFMYRAPYPTIHIIVNQDLASMSIRDVSRVKRLNAQRMAKLGWDGLEGLMVDDVAPTEG